MSAAEKRVVGKPAKKAPAQPVRHPPRLVVAVYCDKCTARLHLGPTTALREGVAVVAGMEGWSRITSARRWAVFHGVCPRCSAAARGYAVGV